MTLWHPENKMKINEKENYFLNQFQVGYMLNPELNINKASKDQVEINLANPFSDLAF